VPMAGSTSPYPIRRSTHAIPPRMAQNGRVNAKPTIIPLAGASLSPISGASTLLDGGVLPRLARRRSFELIDITLDATTTDLHYIRFVTKRECKSTVRVSYAGLSIRGPTRT